MATAADKKKWDSLHAAWAKARAAEDELTTKFVRKYSGSYQDSWLTRAERTKKDKLRDKRSEIETKIFEHVVKISPRGERWKTGVPSHWVVTQLTWEDAVRPANEPLSVVVPGAWGYRDGTMNENARKERTPMAATRKRKRKIEVDFDDEETVLAEVAQELDEDPDDLKISEDSGLSSFGEGTVYEIETRGGRKSWKVVENHDQMESLALAVVKQDLEQEPEIFNKEFIEQHINIGRLKRDLEPELLSSRTDDLQDMAERDPDRFWEEYERAGFEAPEEEEDEDGDTERRDPEDDEVEELAQHQIDEELRDPMAYLDDIYGDDAAKKAIEIAGIDIEAAAQAAVDEDGAEHFLARYDSNYYETPSGLVYWRDN